MQTLLMESAVRATLIAAVIALVLLAMRIKTAPVLHAVWSSVVVLMMLLPAWLAWGPKASLPVLPSATIAPLDVVPPPSPAGLIETAPRASPVRQDGGFPLHATTTIYLLGLSILLMRLAIGTIRASRLSSTSCVVPVTVGLLHPRIILPESSREWPQAQLDAVLAHEGEHIRRRDPLFQWLALLNRALFWFHPLAWWLERKLSGLAEEACDEAVLAQGHDPRDYSEYLLDLARSVERAGTRVDAVGMAMPGAALPHRIRRMLSGVPVPHISRPRMACTVAVCAGAAVILAAGTLVRAQSQAVAFEVASIKRMEGTIMLNGKAFPASAVHRARLSTTLQGIAGNRFTTQFVTLTDLVMDAYGVWPYQVSGGPRWAAPGGERYEIVAKAEGDGTPTQDQVRLMLQALLAARFQLKLHRETKELPVYELVIGKNGPKLKEDLDDKQLPKSQTSMELLTGIISNFLDHPLVDKTGLQGKYKYTWDQKDLLEELRMGKPAPSIFNAVQEQLGLKLESTKGPVEILVIDSAERPSEN